MPSSHLSPNLTQTECCHITRVCCSSNRFVASSVESKVPNNRQTSSGAVEGQDLLAPWPSVNPPVAPSEPWAFLKADPNESFPVLRVRAKWDDTNTAKGDIPREQGRFKLANGGRSKPAQACNYCIFCST